MSTENPNINLNIPNDGPKISFLETFYGVLFCPKKVFEDLFNEDSFTVAVYGILAVILSNLGKLEPGSASILNLLGVELTGLLIWLLVAVLIFFASTVFKTPNSNFGRLLGFTGLSSIPFLLLAPISLVGNLNPFIYSACEVIVHVWSFVLFWIALAKGLQLEGWRVLLIAIIPFLLGIFLFAFLIANLFGFFFSGMLIH